MIQWNTPKCSILMGGCGGFVSGPVNEHEMHCITIDRCGGNENSLINYHDMHCIAKWRCGETDNGSVNCTRHALYSHKEMWGNCQYPNQLHMTTHCTVMERCRGISNGIVNYIWHALWEDVQELTIVQWNTHALRHGEIWKNIQLFSLLNMTCTVYPWEDMGRIVSSPVNYTLHATA